MHHKLGWHMPDRNEGLTGACWAIMGDVPPDAIVLMIGQGVTSDDVRRILQLNPRCHVIGRWWTPPGVSVQTVIDKYVEFVSDQSWNDVVPTDQRWVQPWNEVNKADGGEGFGATEEQMQRFNDAFLQCCAAVRNANPTWKVMFPALTPGNRDAWFPGDDVNALYYMHGPEAAHADPTPEEIAAAIASCPCHDALMSADAYAAHIYCINAPATEMWDDLCGMRWRVFQRFLPKDMPIFINELGIKGSHHVTAYHDHLREHCSEVISTCLYKLRDEPWNYHGGNPEVATLRSWFQGLGPPPEPTPQPESPQLPLTRQQLRARVGVVGTNNHSWRPAEHDAARRCKLEAIGVFNFNSPGDGHALLDWNPGIEFVVRLWSDGFNVGWERETPQQFVDNCRVGLGLWVQLAGDADVWVQVHNEPNLENEGWGPTEADALSFCDWFCRVYDGLRDLYPKEAENPDDPSYPNVHFGFPGLCPHHNDYEWLDWCAPAIEKADFLCVHSYGYDGGNHLNPDFGLRYRHYLDRWGAAKRIYITEFNCGSADWSLMAPRYVEWYCQVIEDSRTDYGVGTPSILGALSFILSSHDADFDPLMWVARDGAVQSIVPAIEASDWPPLFDEEPPPEPSPRPPVLADNEHPY